MANLIQVPGDYPTIQDAINNASSYDTILVAAGTYNETLVMNKTIQLLGAQAGVDARIRTGAQESIIAGTGSRPFQVNADNVVIDGFTVQGNTLGHGISVGNVSGYWIFNNIIQNNALGLFLNPNSGTTTSQVIQNLFKNNIDPTTSGGTGIFSHATNLFIDSNRFTGQREFASINLTTDSTNVIVSRNDILNDTSITLVDSTNIKIANNRLINTQGTAIFIAGNTNITEIEGNIISGSTGNGISVNNVFSPLANQNIRAKDNSIEANQLAGLNVNSGSYNQVAPNRPLDATNNWWGNSSGPNYNGTGPGTGDEINDPDEVVIFEPFLTSLPAIAPQLINRIVNGGFETGALAPWVGFNAAIDARSRTGLYGARLTGGALNAYIYQSYQIDPGENEEVTVSLSKVGASNIGNVLIEVLYYDSNLNFVGIGEIVIVPVSQIPDYTVSGFYYTSYQMATASPLNATQALLLINKLPQTGSPDILVDDVVVLACSS